MIHDFGNGFVCWRVGDKIVSCGPQTCFVIDKKAMTCEVVVSDERICCLVFEAERCLEPAMHMTKGGGLHSILCVRHAMKYGYFPLTPAQLDRELKSAGILCTNILE
jgi:hypothetical protein